MTLGMLALALGNEAMSLRRAAEYACSCSGLTYSGPALEEPGTSSGLSGPTAAPEAAAMASLATARGSCAAILI